MYRNQGIRANATAPGDTRTAITLDLEDGAHDPAALEPRFGHVGRTSEAAEQAAVIVFPTSDAVSGVNGAIVAVDDGRAAVRACRPRPVGLSAWPARTAGPDAPRSPPPHGGSRWG
ncbi:SDR family oxidoreductase [Streptomyces sp. NPDC001165]|uniref:SDR family oxidoreductase n=1 Tax=Streptomyces sp. NPDC001165 TaxID=3364546 RepID=UPI0036A61DB5